MTLNKLSCIIATGLFISMFSFDSMASTLDNADSLNLSDIYYEQEIDEYEESKRIIKYGIQNTGTLDGVLGTKYSLTLTDITPDDFTFSVLIGDKETVWTDLTGEIVGDELVYYLPNKYVYFLSCFFSLIFVYGYTLCNYSTPCRGRHITHMVL